METCVRNHSLFLVIGVTVGALTGCNSAMRVSEPYTTTFAWGEITHVEVQTFNGSIDIEPAAGLDAVSVSGEKRAGGATLEAARDNLSQIEIIAEPGATPATLRIVARAPLHVRHSSGGADLSIRLPAAVSATLFSANGAITARGLRGPLEIETSNGRIEARDMDGDLSAETSNGAITAENIRGAVDLDTSNGAIELRDVTGSCAAQTSNGRIVISGALSDVEAATTNGRVELSAAAPDGAALHARTSNGSIEITVPHSTRGRLMLKAGNGGVEAQTGVMALSSPKMSRNRLEADMNGGGAGEIVATTSNGKVILRTQ